MGSRSPAWFHEQWIQARTDRVALLVVDEIQKVENWSSAVKRVWDEQVRGGDVMDLVLLGSSSLAIGRDARLDAEEKGRAFELAVGAALLRLPGRVYYWRHGIHEVDYVYEWQKNVTAVEVKSGRRRRGRGLLEFEKQFPGSASVIITPENFVHLETLVSDPLCTTPQ